MIRFLILVALLLTFAGCRGSEPASSDTPDAGNLVASTELTQSMIGSWSVNGEIALIVKRKNDKVEFSIPEIDTWRSEISDAEIVGQTVQFVQKLYLRDGSPHPFNGVACNSTVQVVDPDTLELKVTTKDSPDLGAERLKRMQ